MNIGDLVDGGFAEIKTGPFGTQLRASDYVDSGRPVLNVRNVGFGNVRSDKFEYINEETAERLSSHLVRAGDIVFGRKGAVERHAFIPIAFDGAIQGSDCIRLRVFADSPVSPGFITFALRTREHLAWMQAFCSHGATMASLNQDIVRQIPLPEISPGRQRLAVEILQTIDDLIENNQRRIEVMEEMAQSIYREWFVHFRHPEAVSFVDSPIGSIPCGWSATPLKAIAEVNAASRVPNPDETIQYLDISALGERHVLALTHVPGAGAPGRARRVVAPGDVVWSMVRPNRRAHALLVRPGDDWIASTGLAVISPLRVPSSYLFESVSSSTFSDYLVSRESGAAYPAVKPKDFEDAPVLVPSPEILIRFDEAVGPLHQLTWSLRAGSASLASLRDLLLPPLVRGQIDETSLDVDVLFDSSAA